MKHQRLFRYWMTCETEYIPEDIFDTINEQLEDYIQTYSIKNIEKDLSDKLKNITISKNISETTLVFSFKGEKNVLVALHIGDIEFETDYQKQVVFPECIKNYIIYYFILTYNEYILDKCQAHYINMDEDYKR